MKRENQRVAITKRLLREALVQLLDKKPVGKISVTELCAAAGVNRATFYRHYTVPGDLLTELAGDLLEELDGIRPKPTSTQDALPWLERFFRQVALRADLIRLLIRCNSEETLRHLLDAYNQALLEIRAAESGFDRERLELLMAFLAGGGYHLVRVWLLSPDPLPPEAVARLVYDLVNNTLEK